MGSEVEEVIVNVGDAAEAVNASDDASIPVYEIESLCMRCEDNGITKILMTRIPHFREVVLMAFECNNCNERNNEVQFAGQIAPRGCTYELKVPAGEHDVLNRQVVKSDSASIKIPELDFEIPPQAQRGTLSTVEGILVRAMDDLQALQDERKKVDPKTAESIDEFLLKLRILADGEKCFTFILNDPAGNSFIENPFAPSMDPLLTVKFYDRSPEQLAALGYVVNSLPSEVDEASVSTEATTERHSYVPAGTTKEPHGSIGAIAGHRAIAQVTNEEDAAAFFKYSAPEEVMNFPSTCGACGSRCETRMHVTKIPYFQEVIVMASSCDQCGYRNSELKPGGAIPGKGKRITVQICHVEDLSRDVIKSDSAGVKIPEIDLELAAGTLGGLVTTVEGLVTKIKESLERVHGFTFGDSLDECKKSKWQEFSSRLEKLLKIEEPWTLILDDPLANSFIAPATECLENDHRLTFEEYERTLEQNEELGLNDMDTSAADTAYDA